MENDFFLQAMEVFHWNKEGKAHGNADSDKLAGFLVVENEDLVEICKETLDLTRWNEVLTLTGDCFAGNLGELLKEFAKNEGKLNVELEVKEQRAIDALNKVTNVLALCEDFEGIQRLSGKINEFLEEKMRNNDKISAVALNFCRELNGKERLFKKVIDLFDLNKKNYPKEMVHLANIAMKIDLEQMAQEFPGIYAVFMEDNGLLREILNLLTVNFEENLPILKVSAWKVLGLQYKHLWNLASEQKGHKFSINSWNLFIGRLQELLKEIREIQAKKEDSFTLNLTKTFKLLIKNLGNIITHMFSAGLEGNNNVTIEELILKSNIFEMFRDFFSLQVTNPLTLLLLHQMTRKKLLLFQ